MVKVVYCLRKSNFSKVLDDQNFDVLSGSVSWERSKSMQPSFLSKEGDDTCCLDPFSGIRLIKVS